MCLKNNNIKPFYITGRDNIQKDLYVRSLESARYYKRMSGYFDSKSVSLFGEGLFNLYKNNGKYQLLISTEISESDFNKIKSGYELKKIYDKKIFDFFKDYDDLTDEEKKNFSNVAYLISINLVEIRVAFTKKGIMHAKVGIVSDGKDKILFSGSLNETRAAFLRNYEVVSVEKSWESNYVKKSIDYMEEEFNRLWENDSEQEIVVKEFDEILKENLISYGTNSLPDKEFGVQVDLNGAFRKIDFKLSYGESLNCQYDKNQIQLDFEDFDLRLIGNLYTESTNPLIFKSNLDRKQVSTIVDSLSKYLSKEDVSFQIDDSVYDYIKVNHEVPLKELKNMGIKIKNKDKDIIGDYSRFEKIVNSEMKRKLRTQQMWSSFFMAKMQRAGNFSVPGSGKTSMVYGTFSYLRKVNKVDKIIVFGPLSVFNSWRDEYKENFDDRYPLKYLDRYTEVDMFSKKDKDFNLILFNYDSIIKNKDFILKELIDEHTMVIFDECHKIKKVDSKISNLCIKISKKVDYCYCLTGTPIPNSYKDIWNFMHILYDDYYGDIFGLSESLLSEAKDGTRNSKKINDKIYPFYWRTNKTDLNVPAPNENHKLISKTSSKEEFIAERLWDIYESNPIILYTRLIQLSSNPDLLIKSIQEDYSDNYFEKSIETNIDKIKNTHIEKSNKYISCIDLTVKLLSERKKVIIWCFFKDTMEKLEKDLTTLGNKVSVINGEKELPKRQELINEFKHSDVNVLISNPQTMGESVSLHDVCHDAIYLEYSFNLTHMLQSRDRIHRLGLSDKQETNYYYLFSESDEKNDLFIDKKIYKRLDEKKKVMEKAVDKSSLYIEPDYNDSGDDEIKRIMNEK